MQRALTRHTLPYVTLRVCRDNVGHCDGVMKRSKALWVLSIVTNEGHGAERRRGMWRWLTRHLFSGRGRLNYEVQYLVPP